jgi:hypothetical protein
MADIFLSYAREDRAAAERIAQALTNRDYTVWWDRDIPAGPSYAQVIEQALTSAKCVVVLWSAASVSSSWVQDEAREGQERRVLVAARLADVKPPLGFRGHQLADLTAWVGDTDDFEFRRLLRGIEAYVRPQAQPGPEPSPLPELPVRRSREAPGSAEADVPRRRTVVPLEASAPDDVAPTAQRPSEDPTWPMPVSSTLEAEIPPTTPPARILEHDPTPPESMASEWPSSDGRTSSLTRGEAPRHAMFGRRNGLAIAAAIVVVSGMMTVLLQLQNKAPGGLAAPPDPGSRPATETTTSVAPSASDENCDHNSPTEDGCSSSCAKGDLMSCVVLGRAYLDGYPVRRNLVRGRELLQDACDRGESYGCYALARRLWGGGELAQDRALAERLFVRACDMEVEEFRRTSGSGQNILECQVIDQRGQSINKFRNHSRLK